MTFTVLLRRSSIAGHAPTTAQLNLGELTINTHDGLLYFVQNSGTASVVAIGPTPATANALTTAVTLSLTGDATGNISTNFGSNASITTTLATVNTNVGTFGNSITVPTITVNSKGLVTSVANSTIAFPATSLSVTGDVTGNSTTNAIVLTLANVNTNVGTFSTVTVNAKGLVTAATNMVYSGDVSGTASNATTTLVLANVNSNVGTFGNATTVPSITVNAKGLVTGVSNTTISFPSTTLTATGDATGNAVANSIALTLANVNTNVGTFGSNITVSTITVNAKGLVTAISNSSIAFPTFTATGDATGTSSANSIALTLANVNTNVGTFGNGTAVSTVTVNAKGLVTAVSNTNINVVAALGYTPVNNAVLGVANGVATLNSNGTLTASQIPSSLLGAMQYQGVWNASTNTPALASGVGTTGNFYVVSVAGSTSLNGITQWNVGDYALYEGSTWEKIDGLASEVISVAGRTGVVTLTTADVTGAVTYPIIASGDATGTSATNTITLTLATVNTNVGTFGNTITVPTITVNAKGLVTSVSNSTIAFPATSLTVTGDVTGNSTTNAIVLTLANVNTNVGTFTAVTVNSKGLVTAATNMTFTGDVSGTSSNATTALTLANVNTNVGTFGSNTTISTVTVNAKGLVTAISNTNIAFPSTTLTATGDATGNAVANSIALTLANVNTNVGTFGGNTTVTTVTVNAKGLVTAISNTNIAFPSTTLTATGDATGNAVANSIALTLANVNTNVGTFGNAVIIPTVTVNAKGLVTAVSNTTVTFPATNLTATGDATGNAVANSIALTLANVNTTPGTYSTITVNSKGLVTNAVSIGYLSNLSTVADIIDGGTF